MTANFSASSIPQTGSTGTNFSLINSIYRYVESNKKKIKLEIMNELFAVSSLEVHHNQHQVRKLHTRYHH